MMFYKKNKKKTDLSHFLKNFEKKGEIKSNLLNKLT